MSEESEDDDFFDGKIITKPAMTTAAAREKDGVWTDSDDDVTAGQAFQNASHFPKKVTADQKFKLYQEEKFNLLHKRPKWADGAIAKRSSDSDDEIVDSVSKVTGKLVKKKNSLIRGSLLFNKCTALNADLNRSFGYNSVQFHPKYEIGIVADRKAIDFFRLGDGGKQSENRAIKSYDMSSCHIERVRVTPDGTELIVGTVHPESWTHSIDLTTGKILTFSLSHSSESVGLRGMSLSRDGSLIACRSENGYIHVMDAKVKEFVKRMKMNDDVRCMCFSTDGQRLFAHGSGGQVYVWDVRQGRLVHKFYDEGAVIGTALSASPNGQFLAAGSESGVVNIYSIESCVKDQNPKPVKSLMNLRTEITSINFNHSSELFSFCSREKQNAVRIAHVSSRSVFSNFPYREDMYGRVVEMQFSPESGFAAMAGSERSVNLFRLCHFARY